MSWADANQAYLVASLAAIGEHVDRHAAGTKPRRNSREVRAEIDAAAEALDGEPAINRLCDTFALTAFERSLLLLVAGIELDGSFPGRCAAASGDIHLAQPTFTLALGAIPRAHWSALSPSGPLRFWRMVEIAPGDSLMTARLRIDERILHYLAGIDFVDERLRSFVEPVALQGRLVPSHHDIAQRILEVWTHTENDLGDAVVHLTGPDAKAMARIASEAARHLGMELYRLVDTDIPAAVAERESLIRLWERDAALSGRVLLISHGEAEARQQAGHIANLLRGPIVMAGRDGVELRDRTTVQIDVGRPTPQEQLAAWLDSVPAPIQPPVDSLNEVVQQFDLGTEEIRAAALDYTSQVMSIPDDESGSGLWRAALRQSRPRGESLAQRIEAKATWADLVLPGSQIATLHQIATQVRHRTIVYDDWGFAERESRGLGISALFSGRSGTGKTMAAEVLANELRLDLFRIDLSSVVSKYIGETEKNLRKVFDSAEIGGSILLFDEADALFGKRSEVKDSHDRYANIEVSYLLQRMEAYRGLAILTTNMRDALDPAFLRRIRFSIDFRFPDQELRTQIWERAFPTATPTVALEPEMLSRVAVAGGNIRNIALNAAFMAAGEDTTVDMGHLARAARDEFTKLDRTISEVDLRGWV